MYPLLLNAPYKERLWGGRRIFDILGLPKYENASELWLLSSKPEGVCTVKNGEYKNRGLDELFYEKGRAIGGKKLKKGTELPLFIRLTDAKDRLPIGVSTRERLIYVAEASENSQMIYGFTRDLTADELARRISSNTLSPVCNYVSLKKGDLINIPAGLLHAIGKDVLFFETSHADEEFFAVSDYGRTAPDGSRVTLDIRNAQKIIKTTAAPTAAARLEDTFLYPFGTVSEIPSAEGLSVSLIRLDGSAGMREDESFISVILTSGSAALSYPSGTINLNPLDSVLIPAGIPVKFTGYGDILCSHI